MTVTSRTTARLFGLRAEAVASWMLRLKGYQILARNYVVKGGEIDLVARRRDVVAFVEVKARPTMDEARTAINAQKRRRISRAARHWLTCNGWAVTCVLRGDAILIAPGRWPQHDIAVVELQL